VPVYHFGNTQLLSFGPQVRRTWGWLQERSKVDPSVSALIDLLLYTAQQPLLPRRVDLQLPIGCCSQQLISEG